MTARGRSLPATHLGWQVVDPGAPPISPLIDAVPDSANPQVQLEWRRRVEAENATLGQQHAKRPLWYPIERARNECFVPLFGGSPSTWQAAVATLTAALVRGGFGRVRVANLTRANALERLHRLSAHASTQWATEAGIISPRGSTIDALSFDDVDELTTVIADTVRMTGEVAGGFDTGSAKQTLLQVGRVLEPPVSITGLEQAVQMVLTNVTPVGASFTKPEETDLRRLQGEISRRPALHQDLDRLERNLGSLARFGKDPSRNARRMGRRDLKVKTIEIERSGSAHEFLVGQQVLAHFLIRFFHRPTRTPEPEALVVIGADALPDHILGSLINSAHDHDKQLLMFFERLDDHTKRYLGWAGSKMAVFFTLPNADEAEVAARHLGREFKFVVNGQSISESQTEQWSTTQTVSCDQNTSRSLNFGSHFGKSVSRGLSRGQSEAELRGGGIGRERSVTYGRVHEYVLEPEQFQQLPETAMLVINDKSVTLGDCDPSIRARPSTATFPYQPRALHA